MLSKLGLKKVQPSTPASQLRRIGDQKPLNDREAAANADEAPAPPLAVVEGVSSVRGQVTPLQLAPIETVRRVSALAEVGAWRAIVPGLVSEADKTKCVILDREYSSVVVLATAEFYRSGGHTALIGNIRKKKLSIEAEIVTTAEVIAAALFDGSRRGAASQVVKDDDRNLALYEDLVRGAFTLGASDLHFEIDNAGRSRVLLRRYGRMRSWKEFDTSILRDAVAAGYNTKTKAGTASGASWSSDRSLSTITEHNFANTNVNGRFSTYPVITGLDVVVRLLENDPSGYVPSLEALGYEASQINGPLISALRKNSGLIAMVGGTGSGKSTTLKTMMNELPQKDDLKRYSVEDPVEYRMPGVRQISIQRGADDDEEEVKRKFHSALRMLVRMDPDVAMIGEIRDYQSGQLASEMVQTGHRVLTTVHGDGVVDAMSRMTGRLINIAPEILSTRKFLSAIMYQKLLPKLCPHCMVPVDEVLSAAELEVIRTRFSLNTDKMCCASEKGCENCVADGIESGGTVGVTVAAEIFVPDEDSLALIRASNWSGIETAWRKTRRSGFGDADMTGKTAFEHALYKSSIGLVDPRDIERDFESFSSYQVFQGSGKSCS
jgi:type II secretory ATPase GspE/PulE/Tfp pilus assembly ATPase PilB-like protein